MDLLAVGAGGLVGSNVVARATARGWSVAGTYHSTEPALDASLHALDVTDRGALRDGLAATDPDAVVNCAAMTDVDACERDPERARAVNADAPGALASACADRGIRFAHLSTDYVFGGGAEAPYDEAAATDPRQTYGRTKLDGERAVRRAHGDALVARLSFVYGVHRGDPAAPLTGFPAWVRERLAAGESVPLFTDQHVTPTRAGQAAETVLDLVAAGATGTFHVAGRSCVTPHAFGEAVASRVGAPDSLLDRSSLDAVERPAERPRYTCLDVAKVETRLGRAQPTLATDLDAIRDALTDAP
jgi:dTDP-4-dehydrorhamnose reductase